MISGYGVMGIGQNIGWSVVVRFPVQGQQLRGKLKFGVPVESSKYYADCRSSLIIDHLSSDSDKNTCIT
jgi:hypothetical protein